MLFSLSRWRDKKTQITFQSFKHFLIKIAAGWWKKSICSRIGDSKQEINVKLRTHWSTQAELTSWLPSDRLEVLEQEAWRWGFTLWSQLWLRHAGLPQVLEEMKSLRWWRKESLSLQKQAVIDRFHYPPKAALIKKQKKVQTYRGKIHNVVIQLVKMKDLGVTWTSLLFY